MKRISLLLTFGLSCFLSCQNDAHDKKEKITEEEKIEMKKVDSFEKTDKQKEDSVMEHWKKKMEKSNIGE